jgi:hypothetical protein
VVKKRDPVVHNSRGQRERFDVGSTSSGKIPGKVRSEEVVVRRGL